MRNPARTPFAAIFQNEVLLNSKRIAPYALMILFSANAVLWWGWGPAFGRGWATNSDFFIANVLPVYSFMTLPLFTALIMTDPVIRDFRLRVDPLIFTTSVSRGEYLLGKFFGNFFVLVCCQAAFVLTLFVLQGFRKTDVIVQQVKVSPYVKHFLVFVVISHLVLAAFYFTAGTLTRNVKIVYGLGVSFYPLYIAYQVAVLKSVPPRWQIALDPLLMNWGNRASRDRGAEWVNQLIVTYDADLIANRAGMILIAGVCLMILYARFAIAERPASIESSSMLNLSTSAEIAHYGSESVYAMHAAQEPDFQEKNLKRVIPVPEVARMNEGVRAHLNKLVAALAVELRILRSERSLVVILPLTMLLSFLSLPFQAAFSEATYSAAFASSTASGLMLFLLGVIVFYTGETMHRDRELRIEPVLWATPAPDSVLLLSKFVTTISLALVLIVFGGLTAMATQLLRGHTPVEVLAYLLTYSMILLPAVIFLAAASIALNVLLRDKYLAYAVSIGTAAGLFYLYSQGYNAWLYNPLLYQLWSYADLTGAGSHHGTILIHRLYCLGITIAFLALAHLIFERRSTRGLTLARRLRANGWALLIMVIAAAIALMAGLVIDARE